MSDESHQDAADLRFQFQVVQSLAEGVRQLTHELKDLRKEAAEDRRIMFDMRERVVRIESNTVNEQVAALFEKVEAMHGRVDVLERVNDRRDGATGAMSWVIEKWPGIVGAIATVLIVLEATGKL